MARSSATRVLVLHGPNLNLLGTREPAVYGRTTLARLDRQIQRHAESRGAEAVCRQSNHEGQLIDWIQEAGRETVAGNLLGVILNAGAYTHTSVALHDAIKGSQASVIELHISNVHAREPFRHHSYISPAARGIIVGFGVQGYAIAIDALTRLAKR